MIMTLGLFQLESLMLASARFYLIDLRVMPVTVNSAQVQNCLNAAHVVRAQELERHLKNFNIGKDDPMILFCEDGRLSFSQAERLSKKGYHQVYVVEGGTDGLLREAGDPSSGSSI